MAESEKTLHAGFLKNTKTALLARRDELVGKLDGARCYCKKVLAVVSDDKAATSNHPADNGAGDSCTVDIMVKSRASMRINKEIKEVDQALERLNQGIYGLCEECGEDIEAKRLDVNLTAKRCVSCERDIEADQRKNGRRSTAHSAPLS